MTLFDWLTKRFGDRFVDTGKVMFHTVNETAVPPMGYSKATVWILNDPLFNGYRGEDMAREHYETMLRVFESHSQLAPPKLDPYKAGSALANRLRTMRWDIQFTVADGLFQHNLEEGQGAKILEYLEARAKEFESNGGYITYVCAGQPSQQYPLKETVNETE